MRRGPRRTAPWPPSRPVPARSPHRARRRARQAHLTTTISEENPIAGHAGRCEEAHLGCPCRGDERIHEERTRALTDARASSEAAVECPECGAATTPLAIVSWGNCRACRTAHSRSTHPLRW